MSDQSYVVMPVRADGSPSQKDANEVASALEASLHEKLHPAEHEHNQIMTSGPEPNQGNGPLKRAMDNSHSLYKYISWEDPIRTLASYFGLLALMCGIHYFHWTQWFLKLGAFGLGGVYLASLMSRSIASDFVARIRPEYKQVPESTLNATLGDIHDLVQYLVVQIQKIMYGEDLGKTLGAFVGFTTLFWLIKIMSPFDLGILGLSSAYIAPLIVSPGGREIAQAAKVHAQELAHTTAESTKMALQDTKAKASDLSCEAQHVAGEYTSKTQKAASNWSSKAQNMAGSLPFKAQKTAVDASPNTQSILENHSNGPQETAANMESCSGDVAQNGDRAAEKRHIYQHHVQEDSE
ncbi:Reticulon-domain-containing protein [Xylaria digitata]|nr:Reticulon-domain-containing protein [Xylaria digitata]